MLNASRIGLHLALANPAEPLQHEPQGGDFPSRNAFPESRLQWRNAHADADGSLSAQETPVLTRALFLGTGVYVALLGAVLFLVDSVTMAPYAAGSAPRWLTMLTTTSAGQARILNPPDWTPYTLVGVGGVTILYAIALPRAAWKKD